MKKEFYSNGKLLLSGEYLVLAGAQALAVPTRFGQSLEIIASEKIGITWKSIDVEGSIWYEDFFTSTELAETISVSEKTKNTRVTLLKILREAKKMNPDFLKDEEAVEVITRLNFDRKWGLGTSSTLINNIAQWAEVDAFALLHKSFGGSGYDIAAAQNDSAIIYKLEKGTPRIEKATIKWDFTDRIFFVYLNRKQDSKEGIKRFRSASVEVDQILIMNNITKTMLAANDLSSFEKALQKHEKFISELLKMEPIKEQLFVDYPNIIKSLGAWGGDFVMVVGHEKDQDYFRKKGYNTILSYSEMVK